MPKIGNEKAAARFITKVARETVKSKGSYLAYARDISDDGKVVLNAYYLDKSGKPQSTPITDRDAIRCSVNPDLVPVADAKPAKK